MTLFLSLPVFLGFQRNYFSLSLPQVLVPDIPSLLFTFIILHVGVHPAPI